MLFKVQGIVKIRSADGQERMVKNSEAGSNVADQNVMPGETVLVSAGAKASAFLPGSGSLVIEEESQVQVPIRAKRIEDETHSLELLRGRLFLQIDPKPIIQTKDPTRFRLKTPTLILAVKGTQFFAVVKDGNEFAGVHQGAILVATKRVDRVVEVPLRAGGVIEIDKSGKATGRQMTGEEAGWVEKYEGLELERRKVEPAYDGSVASWRLHAEVDLLPGRSLKNAQSVGLKAPEPIESPADGDAYEGRFSRIPKLNGVSMLVYTKPPRGNPHATEFFVRGIGLKKAIVRTYISSETEWEIPVDLSNGEWIPVAVPFYPENPSAIDYFNVEITDEYLHFGVEEYIIQVAHGSYIYLP